GSQGDQDFTTLAVSQDPQVGGGTFAFAARSEDGRWAIYRSQVVTDANTGQKSFNLVLVAREKGPTDVGGFESLDPSLPLHRPANSGPVLRLNGSGDVVFMGSDGKA